MNKEEAAAIVAKFDGWVKKEVVCGENIYNNPLEVSGARWESQIFRKYLSLDALVPVWEKLFKKGMHEFALWGNRNGWWLETNVQGDCKSSSMKEVVFEAALIATAKAIKELK